MDSGLTNSDHNPSAGITLTPSYGIFYGTIYGANIDYGADEPKLETKFAAGATPVFGDFSIDFNLARRIKFDDPTADRWLPYVTGTYTANDMLSLSLGSGYYIYDDPDTADFWELYGAFTVTHGSGTYFTGEAYWEPDSDGADNTYYALYGTLGVPFAEKFEALGKIGLEGYEDEDSTPTYLWYELGLNYAVNDHIALGVAYHGNDLSDEECPLQAYTDCDDAVFATLTLKGKLSDLPK
jgi:opacity protein-like surface antigen